MFNIFTRPKLAAIFLIGMYLASCNKQEHGVGVGLFSEDNILGAHYVDTFQIQSYSKVDESAISNGLSNMKFGFYNDPIFGATKANFYTQFEIGGSEVNFGDTLNCDSIVLYLKLGLGNFDYYGTENGPLQVNVQLISKNSDFNKDSTYYTNSTLDVNRESLIDSDFNTLIQPNFFDTVYLSRDSNFTVLQVPGVLPIRLKKSFGQEILDHNGTSILDNNDNFLEEYKGLYVSIVGNQGTSVLYIDMTNNSFATTVMLYYKKGSEQELAEHKFIIDDESAHFTSFEHDYENTASLRLKAALLDTTRNETMFIQAGAGFESYLRFPTLTNLLDSQLFIPVNKVELIIPVEPGSAKDFPPPSQLFVFRINDEGKEELVLDQYFGNIGGFYEPENNYYKFNLIKHVQAILNGDFNDNGLVLKTSSPGNTINRVLLNGNQPDTIINKYDPMHLRVYYSSLIN